MRIVHLSDLHFGAHSDRISNALLEDIAGLAANRAVISGDFTQIGSEAEFRMARTFLDMLPLPYFAVPGNHDLPVYNLWERFTDPYRRYRRHIATELEPFWQGGGIAMAGLKTSRRALIGLDWSDGAISAGQLRRLKARFLPLPADTFRIVVAHHPLLHPAEGGVVQDIVSRSDRALAGFAEAGVRLVLSGHFHVGYVRYHQTTTADGATTPPVIVLQTGSAISTRLRSQPNAYNVIDIEDGAVLLRQRIWTESGWADGARFAPPTPGK